MSLNLDNKLSQKTINYFLVSIADPKNYYIHLGDSLIEKFAIEEEIQNVLRQAYNRRQNDDIIEAIRTELKVLRPYPNLLRWLSSSTSSECKAIVCGGISVHSIIVNGDFIRFIIPQTMECILIQINQMVAELPLPFQKRLPMLEFCIKTAFFGENVFEIIDLVEGAYAAAPNHKLPIISEAISLKLSDILKAPWSCFITLNSKNATFGLNCSSEFIHFELPSSHGVNHSIIVSRQIQPLTNFSGITITGNLDKSKMQKVEATLKMKTFNTSLPKMLDVTFNQVFESNHYICLIGYNIEDLDCFVNSFGSCFYILIHLNDVKVFAFSVN